MLKTKAVVQAHFCNGTKYFPFHGWSIPLSPRRQKTKKDRKKKRKERLATIFSAAASCLPTSQSGSQPVHHEASHPASKQANRSISFSGATGTGPSNATKQRATVLHHFPSERPSRPQPLITRHCQSAEHQDLHRTGHFTAFCYSPLPLYHRHTKPVPSGRVLFQLPAVSMIWAAQIKKPTEIHPTAYLTEYHHKNEHVSFILFCIKRLDKKLRF